MNKKPIPTFFCLGAQKAGTTTLHNILKQHPDIYLPPRKEAQFFDVNERYKKGLEYYYTEFFNTYNGENIVGNINPNLQLETRSIDRIIDSFGTGIKCIFIMRDPVDRAYSHYLMSKRRGYEKLDFLDAVAVEKDRINHPVEHTNYDLTREPGHYEKNNWGYVYRSKYYKTIEYLYQKFPAENIKIILFEEFISNRKQVINEVLTFIGASSNKQLSYTIKSNAASAPKNKFIRDFIHKPNFLKEIYSTLINIKTRDYIREKIISLNSRTIDQNDKALPKEKSKHLYKKYFKDEVVEIEGFLNISLSTWEKKYL